MLAHVLAWQEEALLRLRQAEPPSLGRPDFDLDTWNAYAHRRLLRLTWEEVLAGLDVNHRELRRNLTMEPPRWFGPCTYWHYTDHTRTLLALLRSSAQSPTTTVAPIAVQS